MAPNLASRKQNFKKKILIEYLGTTLAIVMHELPHELGDFIVYKKLGLKTRQALALNFIAALVRNVLRLILNALFDISHMTRMI